MQAIPFIVERFRNHEHTRLLAFGSSNTEHFLPGMHWFDCYELAMHQTHGVIPRCINSGVGGDTAQMLLDRFDEDAALYQPHLTFITVGGNDSNPERHVTEGQFRANLLELHRRFASIDCAVVFQTYYAPDPATVWPLGRFYVHMDTVREVAAETRSDLIDHLARWEPFRNACPEQYAAVMRDGFHVRTLGNMVIGLDIARHFGLTVGTDRPEHWREARAFQALLDAAEREST